MLIRQLAAPDAEMFRSLRLFGLAEAPTSFASSYEEEVERSVAFVEAQLSPQPDRGIFGAFDGADLIGIAGLGRENLRKLSHKAFLWGVYVAPNRRGVGVSKRMVAETIDFARSTKDIRQINLTVNANNPSAIRLYSSFGFEVFGSESCSMIVDGEAYDELHMTLRFATHL